MKTTINAIIIFFLFISIYHNTFAQVVVLDPGHGGIPNNWNDPDEVRLRIGALGNVGIPGWTLLFPESNVNLNVTQAITNNGWTSLTKSRTNDVPVPLTTRVNLAGDVDADIVLSVHHNGNASKFTNGTETLWSRYDVLSGGRQHKSDEWAAVIQTELLKAFPKLWEPWSYRKK